MTRAAGYFRVSTVAQRHDLQFDEVRRVAGQRGLELTEYTDTASGSGKALPERDRLVADVKRGLYGTVIVWRFDRFARSARDLLEALEAFQAAGVTFVSVSEGIDTGSPMGKLVFTMTSALAEFEKSLIGERVRSGMSAARRRGKRIGRPPCEFDHEAAAAKLGAGMPKRAVARKMRVSPRTLRRKVEQKGP